MLPSRSRPSPHLARPASSLLLGSDNSFEVQIAATSSCIHQLHQPTLKHMFITHPTAKRCRAIKPVHGPPCPSLSSNVPAAATLNTAQHVSSPVEASRVQLTAKGSVRKASWTSRSSKPWCWNVTVARKVTDHGFWSCCHVQRFHCKKRCGTHIFFSCSIQAQEWCIQLEVHTPHTACFVDVVELHIFLAALHNNSSCSPCMNERIQLPPRGTKNNCWFWAWNLIGSVQAWECIRANFKDHL